MRDKIELRLSPDLRQRLEEAAGEERRKPSQLVRIFIEDALAARRRAAAAGADQQQAA